MKVTLTVLLCCYLAVVGGQTGRIEYFTVTDGLATREINGLHIGDDGYLWVATMDGLNRFDGHGFLQFDQGELRNARLSHNAVGSISKGNDDKLIIAFKEFYGFFDRFDPRTFTVEQVRMVPSTGVVGYPRAIVTDQLGRTFVVTIGQSGTILYEYTDRGFVALWEQPEDGWLSFAPRVELLPLANGQFLLYDEEHNFRHLSAAGKLIDRFTLEAAGKRRFYTMEQGPDGYVYLSFREGYPLYRWRPGQKGKPDPVPKFDSGLVYPQIFRDELGQLLFLATEDILGKRYPDEYYLLDTAGQLSLFERDLPTDRLITTAAAINFKETTYLGLREGLGVMQRYVKPIRNYLTSDTKEATYQHEIRGITEDAAGTVYIIEADGMLYTMARGSQELQPVILQSAEGRPVRMRDAGQLVYDRIRDVVWGVAQPDGYRRGGLLFRYNVATEETLLYTSPYPLSCLAISQEGKVYLGSSDPREAGVLLSFDPETFAFTEVLEAGGVGEQLRNLRLSYLHVSREGKLLLGTEGQGLISYDPVSRSARTFLDTFSNDRPAAFANPAINSIYEDNLGRYWLGTNAGLQVVDPADGSSEVYGRKDGLSSNIVVGLLPDSVGGYWLSTNNGLVHLPQNPREGSYRRYYVEDGLVDDEFNRYSFHRDRSGRYFFGGDRGLSVFRDVDLSSETAGSDVMLTEVAIYGRGESRSITRELDELTDVVMYANEKSIAVSFALPVGQRPSQMHFRVKLEGFTEDWRELRNERTVRYNNLPGGHYTLMVQGAGANGNYGDQVLSLNIHVRQYLFERLWFQFLIALVIAGLFFFIFQGRLKERLRNEQLRTQLSSDIHDEVSGLLAGITLQAELLQNRTEDEKMRNRLRTVGDAGRNAMSKMSDVIWSIDSRRDTTGNLMQRMQEHADEVLLPLDIRYDFRVSGMNSEREIAGTVRQDLYFIYKEAINNIARHSNATYVEIELEQFAQTFEMFIRDNGVGTKGKEEPAYSSSRFTPKTGQGKDNIRMRAERLNAVLTIDDRSGYTLTLRMRRLS